MRFHIDCDTGDLIQGWIVPDNPLAVSRVAVSAGGRRIADVPAAFVDEKGRRNVLSSPINSNFKLPDKLKFKIQPKGKGLSPMRQPFLYESDFKQAIS